MISGVGDKLFTYFLILSHDIGVGSYSLGLLYWRHLYRAIKEILGQKLVCNLTIINSFIASVPKLNMIYGEADSMVLSGIRITLFGHESGIEGH